MRGSNLLGGGLGGPRMRGEKRARWLAHARAWHVRMKPIFDEMDAQGMFADSPTPPSPATKRERVE